MVGHRVEITWPINPLPPSKRKKHGKNISQIDIYGVSRCKPIPPPHKKRNLSHQHQTGTNKTTIWLYDRKKKISKSTSLLKRFLTPTNPWFAADGVGWLDRQCPAVHHFFQIQSSPGEFFLWVSHGFTMHFLLWDGVTHQENMKARKISTTKTSVQLKLQ